MKISCDFVYALSGSEPGRPITFDTSLEEQLDKNRINSKYMRELDNWERLDKLCWEWDTPLNFGDDIFGPSIGGVVL